MAVLNLPVFDDTSRPILRNLANALLPLEEWICARKPPPAGDDYEPPDSAELPWRQGEKLSVDRLGAIEFIEALLRESSGDVLLLRRWQSLQADPLKHCPFENPGEWRAARGLLAPAFGAVKSQNVLLDNRGNQIARSEFYAAYLPHLVKAAELRRPANESAWLMFARELFSDSCKEWSGPGTERSSRFMLQFLRDLLYAILGMRNPVPERWRSAVLTEIGEFRRPGNVYSRKDVKRGLDDFKKVIASYRVAKAPALAAKKKPKKAPALAAKKILLVEERLAVPTVAPEPAEEHPPAGSVKAHYLAWTSRGPLADG